jgi:hypothetical protein
LATVLFVFFLLTTVEKREIIQWPIEKQQTMQWPIEKRQTIQWPIEKKEKQYSSQ